MPFSEMAIPIFCGPIVDNEFDVKINYGTSFPIAPNIFVTANHSVAEPQDKERYLAFGFEEDGRIRFTTIKAVDRFEEIDIAIVETHLSIPGMAIYKWLDGQADMITDIISVGYGFSLRAVDELKVFSQRAFKGYIISIVYFCDFQKKFNAYQLSFRAPKGQSGASVFVRDLFSNVPQKSIIGVVVGNRVESITCGDSEGTHTEVIKEGKNTETVTTVEASQFAIVVPTTEILPLHSEILGKTVREYLLEKDLIVARPTV